MSTELPTPGQGEHVLVLAINTLSHDTRILKQIGSLVRGGYQVSVIAIADDKLPDHELEDPERHVYRFRMRRQRKNPLSGCPGAKEGLYEPLEDYFKLFNRSSIDRAYLQKALRLQRSISGLHWSGKVRRERRKYHRELRARMNDLIAKDDSSRTAKRFATVAWYEIGALGFVDGSAEFEKRVADLGPPKVVHAHDVYTLTAGVMLAKRWGAKLVYDAHEYEPERGPEMPEAMKTYFTRFEDVCIAKADAMITVSQSILDLYQTRSPKLHINLIQNCPEHRLAPEEPVQNLREMIGLAPGTPMAVFVGLPTLFERGLQVTLEAMLLCPELHLAVIGPRWERQDNRLMQAVTDMELTERVHLLQPVKPHEVTSAIRDADMSICLFQDTTLNHRFAMPNKLFEGLLSGVPMLVSDFPEMGALVRRLEGGLAVDPTDPQAIAAAMQKILADRSAFVPTGSAREELERICSWEGQEQVLLGLYNRLLPSTSSSKVS